MIPKGSRALPSLSYPNHHFAQGELFSTLDFGGQKLAKPHPSFDPLDKTCGVSNSEEELFIDVDGKAFSALIEVPPVL